MNMYRFLKLVSSVDRVDTRKRLQKCVYLVQLKGGDLEAEYKLHYFGPYSKDVADATDVLVLRGLLEEKESPNQAGRQFAYTGTGPAGRSFGGTKRPRRDGPNRYPSRRSSSSSSCCRVSRFGLWNSPRRLPFSGAAEPTGRNPASSLPNSSRRIPLRRL